MPGNFFLTNKTAYFRTSNCLQKGFQLCRSALGSELNPAIRQISHRPSRFKTCRE